jgi:hypothetical protein
VTTAQLVTLGLYAAAAGTAIALARHDKRHRPVAWCLAVILALDVARLGLKQLLPPGPEVRVGWDAWLRHLGQAAYVGIILARPAMAMRLWIGWRPCLVVAAGAAVWFHVVASYPGLRLAPLLELYSNVEFTGAAGSVLFFGLWAWRRPSAEIAATPMCCGVVLCGASLAVMVVPGLTGPGLLEHWLDAVKLHGVALAVVVGLQLRELIPLPGDDAGAGG